MKKKYQTLVIFGSGPHARLSLNEVLKLYIFKNILFFNDKIKSD